MLLRLIISRYVAGFILLSAILFLPAGTLNFYRGWVFLIMFFALSAALTIYFYIRDPALLERRMRAREREKEQKFLVKVSSFLYGAGLTIPGFDFRFGWSNMPVWLSATALTIFLVSYLYFFLVLKANSFASRVIEVEPEQKVIDTGPYAYLRHPMYTSAILIALSMPLILGSYYALILFATMPAIFVYRLLNEEKYLSKNLYGYKEYCERVKYRLVPFVW